MVGVPKLPNLEGCSSEQLGKLLQEIKTASDSARQKEEQFAEKLQSFLSDHGVTEDQALESIKLLKKKRSITTGTNKGTQENTGSSKKARSKPKYVHPDKSKVTWCGEGKKPEWLQKFIDQGRSEDEFLIKPKDKTAKPKPTAETSSTEETDVESSTPTVVDGDVNVLKDDEDDINASKDDEDDAESTP